MSNVKTSLDAQSQPSCLGDVSNWRTLTDNAD